VSTIGMDHAEEVALLKVKPDCIIWFGWLWFCFAHDDPLDGLGHPLAGRRTFNARSTASSQFPLTLTRSGFGPGFALFVVSGFGRLSAIR